MLWNEHGFRRGACWVKGGLEWIGRELGRMHAWMNEFAL